MIAPSERRARASAALYVMVTTVVWLFLVPADGRAQLATPVMDAAMRGLAVEARPEAAPVRAGPLPVTRTRSLRDSRTRSRPAASRGFRDRQLLFPRVRRAYTDKWASVGSALHEVGMHGPAEIFLRVFKREQVLEVWARPRGERQFSMVRNYPVCDLSGRLGPKRREGDGQIPEGFYSIDMFNPWSEYHLSMRVDYPNAVDRVRSGRVGRLGGDIFIHGGCATVGCVPIGDEWIEELYVLAVEARNAGQRRIPVHIFPTRLDVAGMRWLAGAYGRTFVDYPFWENLQEGYLAFERTRTLPAVGSHDGRYVVVPEPEAILPAGVIAAVP